MMMGGTQLVCDLSYVRVNYHGHMHRHTTVGKLGKAGTVHGKGRGKRKAKGNWVRRIGKSHGRQYSQTIIS